MAASENPRGLGLPGPGRDDDGATIHLALSREEIQLWVSGVPGPGRSSGNLEDSAAGRDWRTVDRRIHDGPGSERERVSVSPPGLRVLQRGRERGRSLRVPPILLSCLGISRAWDGESYWKFCNEKTLADHKSGILARIWGARATSPN